MHIFKIISYIQTVYVLILKLSRRRVFCQVKNMISTALTAPTLF